MKANLLKTWVVRTSQYTKFLPYPQKQCFGIAETTGVGSISLKSEMFQFHCLNLCDSQSPLVAWYASDFEQSDFENCATKMAEDR